MSVCFIYVIGRRAGPVKIGISANPSARVATLQTGCPFKIALLHVAECHSREEAELREKVVHHEHFASRLSGEWFKLGLDCARESLDVAKDTVARMTAIGAM